MRNRIREVLISLSITVLNLNSFGSIVINSSSVFGVH